MMRGQSAKDPEAEGTASNIEMLDGGLCKDIHDGGGISLCDSQWSSAVPSSEGTVDKISKIEGVLCKDLPSGDPIPDADGANAENTEVGGVICKDLPLKNRIPHAGGISNIFASSSSSDADVAGSAAADVAPRALFSSGFSSVIGRRAEMEDFVAVVPGFVTVSGDSYDFFAVYDGHGSGEVAELCADRMHVVLAEEAAGSPSLEGEEAAGSPSLEGEAVAGSGEWWRGVMERCFERVDDEAAGLDVRVGSTAVVAVVGPRSIVVANCGDSRAVMSRGGEAVALSTDHKPDRLDEMERIESSGGWVVDWHGYRVLGVLATSRSLGDYDLKPFVISKPELTVIDRTEEDEFLILASDGLWDVVSNGTACRVVRNCLTGRTAKKHPEAVMGYSAETAATLLTRMAVTRRSLDNVSVVVVQFSDLRENALVEDAISLYCSSI